MGTEDWVHKGTKLIINTKKQRLKIQSRVWNFKNIMLKKRRKKKREREKEKKNKVTKIIKNIYMKFALKKQGLFFLQSNSRL